MPRRNSGAIAARTEDKQKMAVTSTATGLQAVSAFESSWREMQVRKRWMSAGYGSLFLIALLASAWIGEFNLQKLY